MTQPSLNTGEAPIEPAGEVIQQSWFGLAALVSGILAIGFFAAWSWVVIIVALVVMIAMHELGHYLTAKWSGMKVTEFFIGFGPKIWSFHRGETEYGIKAVWLGAYVRIIGMSSLDVVDPSDESRTYRQKSYPRRLMVAVAGSTMHFLMALVLLFVLFLTNGLPVNRDTAAVQVDGWTLGSVSVDSAAFAAGLQPGDELLTFDSIDVSTFSDFGDIVRSRAGETVSITFRHDGKVSDSEVVIGERLTPAGAAGIEGLIARDRILAVDGLEIDHAPSYPEFADYVRDRLGEPLSVTVVDGRTGEPGVVEGVVVDQLVDPKIASIGFFGVSANYESTGLGVLDAGSETITTFGSFVKDVTLAFPKAITGGLNGAFDGILGNSSVSTGSGDSFTAARQLELRRLDSSNPDESRILSIYGVAGLGAAAVESGLADTLSLLFVINVFIGVFNLIPLLPLDGGHVAVATYERLRSIGGRRYRVDAAKLLPITYVVVLLLVFVGGVTLLRDIFDPVNFG